MFDYSNPFQNTIITYTVIILLIYIIKPSNILNEDDKIVDRKISLIIMGAPIVIYILFIILNINQKNKIIK